jgi:hypothetical protein
VSGRNKGHAGKKPKRPVEQPAATLSAVPGEGSPPVQEHPAKTEPPGDGYEYRRKIWEDFREGLGLSVLVFVVAFGFQLSPWGEHVKWATFRFSQWRLKPAVTHVSVVDISGLEQDAGGVTRRDKLQSLLQQIANSNPSPAVIGVDLDFAPEQFDAGNGTKRLRFVDPKDPAFFDFCQSLNVPVFLGIYRTRELPRDQWLGLPLYRNLAAALLVDEHPKESLVSTEAPTMAFALAGKYRESLGESDGVEKKGFFLERESETEAPGVTKVTTDYSVLKSLRESVIPFSDLANASAKTNIGNRIVIIGDLRPAKRARQEERDRFPDPAFSGEDAAGVLILASAANTLADRETSLYTLKQPWETGADLLLAFLILLMITRIRLLAVNYTDERPLLLKLAFFFTACVLLLGFFVNRTRFLWDGFLIVAVAVLVHPFLHHPYALMIHWLEHAGKVVYRSVRNGLHVHS